MANKTILLPVLSGCAAIAVSLPLMAGEPVFGEPTLYGRINATVERARISGDSAETELADNASRLGMRAGKAISDETLMMIQLEGRIRPEGDHSGWILKPRDNWVGIKNETLGTLRLGRMEGPLYHAIYDEISMHNHDSGRSSDKLIWEDATGGRMTKSVYYRAPLPGPVKVELLHAFLDKGNGKPHASNPRHDELAVTYEFGESWIAGGYAESRDLDVNKAWTIGACTSIKGVVLAGLLERAESLPQGGESSRRNYARVATKYPLGKHELHANYGVAGNWSGNADSGATQSTLGYNYNLTEKTKIYGYATRIKNDANASYSFLQRTPAGASNTSLALGVRHNF
jgi:predicted porin